MFCFSIPYKQSLINYSIIGKGKKIMLAFHGYGESLESFLFLEPYLQHDFTIIAIDFPFHGKTKWNNKLPFSSADMYAIIKQIMPQADSFYLLGYSLGGRVALSFLQNYSTHIQKVILIAPDGLHNNIWHKISTQTIIGNQFFKIIMQHPAFLFGVITIAYNLKLINKSIYNFVHYYLDDAELRMMLYKRWTTMRNFQPTLRLLKNIIAQNKISVKILFGKYDSVILTKRGIHFQKNIESFVEIKEIEAGHQLLKEKYVNTIVSFCKS